MSDCNACIFGGEPDGYCEVFERTIVKKSRKSFKCCECHREIAPGSSYERTFTVFDGDATAYRTCSACAEIRDTFYCQSGTSEPLSEPLIGCLWDDIHESRFLETLTAACFGKLKTNEAREYLWQRWAKRKGIKT